MAVRAAALRALMEEVRATAREYDVRYVCVGVIDHEDARRPDPDSALIERFDGRRPAVVPVSDCRVFSVKSCWEAPREGETSAVHEETGAPALFFALEDIEWRGDGWARLDVSYLVQPTHGADYDCEVVETEEGWTATCCQVTSVS